MAAIPWPTLSVTAPAELSWELAFNTIEFPAPMAGTTTTVEFPGAKWKVSFNLDELNESDAAQLRAFGARLRGRAGRFTLHNMAYPAPRGTITGTPLVMGAGQSGNVINIDACAVGATLLAGDFFGVNGELKMCVVNSTANGSGQMAVTFEPPLRASPADNALITLLKPTATFMLSADTWKNLVRAPMLAQFPVDAVENWT